MIAEIVIGLIELIADGYILGIFDNKTGKERILNSNRKLSDNQRKKKFDKMYVQCAIVVFYGVVYSNDGIIDEEEQELLNRAVTNKFQDTEVFQKDNTNWLISNSKKLINTLYILETYNIPIDVLTDIIATVRKEIKSLDREYYMYDEYLKKLLMRYRRRLEQ